MKRVSFALAGVLLLLIACAAGAAHNASVWFNNEGGPLTDSVFEGASKEYNVYVKNPAGADTITNVVIYIPDNFTFEGWGVDPTTWDKTNSTSGNYIILNYTNHTLNGDNSQGFHFYLFANSLDSNLTTVWTVNTTDENSMTDADNLNVTILDDDEPPTVSLVSPADSAFQPENVTFECSATDNNQLANITFYWNATGNWSANSTMGVSGNFSQVGFVQYQLTDQASYSWNCWACDVLGNCNSSGSNWTVTIDAIPPEVNVTEPADGWYNGTVVVRFNASDSFSGVTPVVFWNGTSWVPTMMESGNSSQGIWNGTIDTTGLADGSSLVIWANVTDMAGNTNTDPSPPNISVDNSAPTISWVGLDEAVVQAGASVEVGSDGTDPQGVKSCWAFTYYSNDTLVSGSGSNLGTDCNGSYSVPGGLEEGSHFLKVRVRNQVGMEAWGNTTFTVDSTAPLLGFVSPTPAGGSSQTEKSVTINVTHSDLYPGTLMLNWNGGNESWSWSGNWTNITKSGLSDGDYTFFVWVNDSAGNANQTESRTVTIYTPEPPGSPGGGSIVWVPAETCKENWTCTDWSECTGGSHTRSCTDLNNCSTVLEKPTEVIGCYTPGPEEESVRPEPEYICTPGEFRCFGNDVQACSEGVKWITIEECGYRCGNGKCIERPAEATGQPGMTGMILGMGATTLALVVGIIIVLAIGLYWFFFRHKPNFPGYQ